MYESSTKVLTADPPQQWTSDLLALLVAWGPCVSCQEDLDGDDVVGASDLLILLASWGPCP